MGFVLSTKAFPPNQLVKNKMKIPTEIIKFLTKYFIYKFCSQSKSFLANSYHASLTIANIGGGGGPLSIR